MSPRGVIQWGPAPCSVHGIARGLPSPPRCQERPSCSSTTNPESASGPALLPPAYVPSCWAVSAPAKASTLCPLHWQVSC